MLMVQLKNDPKYTGDPYAAFTKPGSNKKS